MAIIVVIVQKRLGGGDCSSKNSKHCFVRERERLIVNLLSP